MGHRFNEKDRKKFTVPAKELAPWLLGKIIVRKFEDDRHEKEEDNKFETRCRINVTEAYCEGEEFNDAVRAEKKGETTSQHKIGGHLYVKPSGSEYRFDVVANIEGVGEGVLIRGFEAYKEGPRISGRHLDITTDLDGIDLLAEDSDMWIEEDSVEVIKNKPTTREGISKSKSEEKLRFSVKEFIFPEKK